MFAFKRKDGCNAGTWDYRRVVVGVDTVEPCNNSLIVICALAPATMKSLRLTFAFVSAVMVFPAAAVNDGRTNQDRPFVSGGVTAAELADLRTKQPFFSLSLLTAARSG